jgi:hypothetical protein
MIFYMLFHGCYVVICYAGAGDDAECILQEQRTLDKAGKNDKESLLALVTEVSELATVHSY